MTHFPTRLNGEQMRSQDARAKSDAAHVEIRCRLHLRRRELEIHPITTANSNHRKHAAALVCWWKAMWTGHL